MSSNQGDYFKGIPLLKHCKTAAARVRRTAINVVDVSDNVSEHTNPDKTVM